MEQSPTWEANHFSVQKLPTFYGTWRFITSFTSAHHLSLSCTRSVQSQTHPSHFLNIYLNIILPSTWVFQVVSFPQVSTPKPWTSPILHTCYMPHPSHSSQFDHLNNTWWGVQIIKLLIMYFSPLPCYLIPHMLKYSPQYPILKHPQPKFLPQCEWPSFTPMQYNR